MVASAKVHPCDDIIDDDDPYLHPPQPNVPSSSNIITRFASTLAVIFFVIVSVVCMIVTIIGLTHRPRNPNLWLNSLSIPTFKTSNSTLTAKYDISFSFKNPNRMWKISFEEIEVIVFYEERYSLAAASVAEAFQLGMEKEKLVEASFGEGAQWSWGNTVLEDIRRDLRKGIVSFNLYVEAKVACYGAQWMWMRGQGLQIYSCLDVDVHFNAGGAGSSIFVPRQCDQLW